MKLPSLSMSSFTRLLDSFLGHSRQLQTYKFPENISKARFTGGVADWHSYVESSPCHGGVLES